LLTNKLINTYLPRGLNEYDEVHLNTIKFKFVEYTL